MLQYCMFFTKKCKVGAWKSNYFFSYMVTQSKSYEVDFREVSLMVTLVTTLSPASFWMVLQKGCCDGLELLDFTKV